MESKSGKISLKYVAYPKASNLSILVSWSCPQSNQEALNCIRHERVCDYKGTPETALCYAIAQRVERALVGDPSSMKKYNIDNFGYNAQGKAFTISYNTKGSLSMMKRTLRALVKKLAPKGSVGKLSKILNSVKQKINSEGKRYVESEVNDGMSKGIQILVVGKMNLKKKSKDPKKVKKPQELLDEATEEIAKNLLSIKDPSGKKSAPILTEYDACPKVAPAKSISVSASDIQLVHVYYYLCSKTQMDPIVGNGKLTLMGLGPKSLESYKKKDAVSSYVKSKYHLGDYVKEGSIYFAAFSGLIDAFSIGKAASSDISHSSIEKSIIAAL
jgi:hypothetical protein